MGTSGTAGVAGSVGCGTSASGCGERLSMGSRYPGAVGVNRDLAAARP
jgi:hypothetical protein